MKSISKGNKWNIIWKNFLFLIFPLTFKLGLHSWTTRYELVCIDVYVCIVASSQTSSLREDQRKQPKANHVPTMRIIH